MSDLPPENVNAAWKPICHRGRFEMFAMTRAYVEQEHGTLLATPLAAEIRPDDGTATLMHFRSAESMAEFVGEMVPTALEVHRAAGEDIVALVALLRAACDAPGDRAREIAEATIARAARP